MILHRYFVPFMLFVSCLNLLAQDRSSYRWYFGEGVGLNFNTTPPTVLNDGKSIHPEGTSVCSNPTTGELILYSDGNSVWNKDHVLIATSLHPASYSSTQSVLIIPQPTTTNIYHLFTTSAEANPTKPSVWHFVIDMTLNNGIGAIVSSKGLIDVPVCEKVTATSSCNNTDVWIVFRCFNLPEFRVFRLTATGLDTQPVVSPSGLSFIGLPFGSFAGEMNISPDGRTLACANYSHSLLDIFDFNAGTGRVSNRREVKVSTTQQPYGLCFSPNSEWLYTTVENDVYRFHLTVPNIQASSQEIASSTQSIFSQMELAPDGKIYISNGLNSVAVISQPNDPNPSFSENYIAINKMRNGLPNFFRKTPPLVQEYAAGVDTTICAGSSVQLGKKGEVGYSYIWQPAANLDNPTLAQPTATVNTTTTFVVQVSADVTGCIWMDSVTVSVRAAPPVNITPSLPAINDTVHLCEGSTLTLRTTAGLPSYRWNTGDTTPNLLVTQGGRYVVEGTDTFGCQNHDTIAVIVHSAPLVTITSSIPATNDSVRLCEGSTLTLRTTSGLRSYRWNTGNTTPDVLVTQGGRYIVEGTDTFGCQNHDTITVITAPLPFANAGADTSICFEQRLQLQGNGGLQYLWQPVGNAPPVSDANIASPFFLAQQSGSFVYSLRVQNSFGCYDYDSLRIDVHVSMIIRVQDTAICQGEQVRLYVPNAQSALRYLWRNESGDTVGYNEIQALRPQSTTRYIVSAKEKDCEGWDTLQVTVYPLPELNMNDKAICLGEMAEVEIEKYEQNTTYVWRDEQGNNLGSTRKIFVSPLQTTRYIVEATNAYGCKTSDTSTVTVEKTQVTLYVADSTGAMAGDNVDIVVYGEASRDIVVTNLHYTLRMKAEMLSTTEGSYDKDDILIHRTKNLALGTKKQEIDRIRGVALHSQTPRTETTITTMYSDNDTNCVAFTAENGSLFIDPTCANRIFTIRLNAEVALHIMPNPVQEDFTIQSNHAIEELQLLNSVGEEVTGCSLDASDKKNLHLDVRNCAAGLYFVRVRLAGRNSWLTRSVIMMR